MSNGNSWADINWETIWKYRIEKNTLDFPNWKCSMNKSNLRYTERDIYNTVIRAKTVRPEAFEYINWQSILHMNRTFRNLLIKREILHQQISL